MVIKVRFFIVYLYILSHSSVNKGVLIANFSRSCFGVFLTIFKNNFINKISNIHNSVLLWGKKLAPTISAVLRALSAVYDHLMSPTHRNTLFFSMWVKILYIRKHLKQKIPLYGHFCHTDYFFEIHNFFIDRFDCLVLGGLKTIKNWGQEGFQ